MTNVLDFTNVLSYINPAFKCLLFDNHRIIICVGGAGSGKSVFAAQRVVIRCLKRKHRYMVVRKVQRSLRDSCVSEIINVLNDFGLHDYYEHNKSDNRIVFPHNGSEIIFEGLDDVSKKKSIFGITSIWIEEATELTLEEFRQLNLRMRGGTRSINKNIIMTLNPINQNHWIYKDFIEGQRYKSYVVHKSTYKDNVFLKDSNYVEELENLKNLNYALYQIYTLAEWAQPTGLVFDANKIFSNLKSPPDDNSADDIFYGIDFGYNNPTAIIKVIKKDQEFYLQEILYKSKLTNNDVIDFLKQNKDMFKNKIIVADCAEPDRIKEIDKAGFNIKAAKKGQNSVLYGINLLKSKNFYTNSHNTNLNKELSTYSWKLDNDGNPLEEPVDTNDHAIDAIRYAIHYHESNKGEKQVSKTRFRY